MPRLSVALASHYAPATPLELWPGEYIYSRVRDLRARGLNIALVTRPGQFHEQLENSTKENIVYVPMPVEPERYGQLLYGTLRRLDNAGLDRLLIEALPDDPQWMAVADRLRRASCFNAAKNAENEVVHG